MSPCSANTFTDEPVIDEQLRAIYDLAKYGSTAKNDQQPRIELAQVGRGRDERLLKLMSVATREKTTSAPVGAELAPDTRVPSRTARGIYPRFAGWRRAPLPDDAARKQSAALHREERRVERLLPAR